MPRAAPPAGRLGVRRRAARAGVRLALVQALVVVAAFGFAGVLTQLSAERLAAQAVREQVMGETRSIADEYALRGAGHLAHTIDKRTRLWRGFGYRLQGGDGPRAGFLPPLAPGWARVAGEPGAADPARRPFLTWTQALPDGERITVGEDLSGQMRQSAALARVLLLCGACGVAFCVAASHLASREAWRRVVAVAEAARAVRDGRLDRRVPVREGPAKDDLDDLALAFNAMLERIELLVTQVRQVSTDIAHDLRTPLTRVRQRLERLQARAGRDAPLARAVAEIDDDLSEILRTFDALLQLAAIAAEDPDLRARPFDLGELAKKVSDAYRPDIEEGGRTLALHVESASIVGEEPLVAQAVANLLDNAMRHTPPGARLELRVEREGGRAKLVVSDDGPGIPAEARSAVLRPLFRLESSRHLPGSGLGLSIVAAVAARCGGAVTLHDADPGLRIAVTFPDGGPPGPPPAPPPAREDRPLGQGVGDVLHSVPHDRAGSGLGGGISD